MKDPETVDNTTIRSIILEQNKKEVLQLDRDRIPNIVDNAELLVIGGEGKAVLGLKIKLPDGSLKILLVADVEVNNRLAEIWNELSPFVKMYEIAAQTPPEEIKEIPEVMEKKDYLKIQELMKENNCQKAKIVFKRQNNEIVFEAEVRYCYFEIENNLYHQGFLVSEKVPTVLVEPTAQQWEPFLDVDFFLWLEEDVRIKFLERTLDGTVSILSAILRPEPQQRRNLKEKIKMEAQSYWRHHWLDLLNQQSLCIFCDPLE